MSFYLAPALRRCPADLGVTQPPFPRRGSSDGWVGDTSHAARKSDHNPDWSSGGVVRAIDLDIIVSPLAGRGMGVVAAAIAHPSTQYIIHAGSIWNRRDGFRRRTYSGNPHTRHVHISIRHTKAAETSTAKWALPGAVTPVAPPTTPPAPPIPKDWFTMATAAELRKVVAETVESVIGQNLPAYSTTNPAKIPVNRWAVRVHDWTSEAVVNTRAIAGLQAQVSNLVGAIAAVSKGEPFDEAKLLEGIRAATSQAILDAGVALRELAERDA